ncbi:MAG: DeoR/GlpR transcriptional regulator [Clostridiales bacterium]|nr:DeoR/GlpR transcriptional regulator [Clostridiales bacterium]
MSYSERSHDILDYLKSHKSASIDELARLLYVSEATIRRDLTSMQKLGLVERSHGGAILSEGSDELSFFIRQTKNAKEKMRTATIALNYLPEFQTVFIDNSSTCLALANRLNLSHKTIVTNGLQLAVHMHDRDVTSLILLGGEISGHTTATLGGITLSSIRDFRFDLALLSCAAVDAEGSYEPSIETMQIKRAAMENSRRKVLIFDGTKINERAPYHTADLNAYDTIITDAEDEKLEAVRAVHPNIYNK